MGVYIVLAGMFALLAVLIAAGWGDWLIAGYNTASKEERSHYYRGRLYSSRGKLRRGVGGVGAYKLRVLYTV